MKLLTVIPTLLFLLAGLLSAAPLPWEGTAPEEIERLALTPNQVLNEKPSAWREPLAALFRPLVKDCSSAREAVLKIASQMTQVTGVYYSMERRHPVMNPLEALEEKKVSCTGQSILLVCALRSVGIPARAVGVLTWNHVQGNHTWCEAWFDGAWHMIEFNERDFNTPWVMESIGMLDPNNPMQRIYAVCPGGAGRFPFGDIPAEDVTPRYMELAQAWYSRNGLPPTRQRLMVSMRPRSATPLLLLLEDEEGREIDRAELPTLRDDVRRFATLVLPREGRHYLRLSDTEDRLPITATPEPVRVLEISRD